MKTIKQLILSICLLVVTSPCFAQAYRIDRFEGDCKASVTTDVSAGALRSNPYNCDSAVLTYLDKSGHHMQIQFTTKQSNDVNATVGFEAVYNSSTKKYDLTNIYAEKKAYKPTLIRGGESSCEFKIDNDRISSVMCTGFRGENSQMVSYTILFLVTKITTIQSPPQQQQNSNQISSQPTNLDNSGIINLQSPGTILASCGMTAKLLNSATSQAAMKEMNLAGSNADASWRAQQDYKALNYMAQVAKVWSQVLDKNYANLIPPSEMSIYLNETNNAMSRFNKMVAINPWNGVQAWQYCVNRYRIGYR